jgi:diguanylate cyclase (GGDEF)-like protein
MPTAHPGGSQLITPILQICGTLALVGLLTMGVLMLRAQRRRWLAAEAARRMGPEARAASADQIQRLRRATRASDAMETALGWTYFLLAVAAAAASIGLGFTRLEEGPKSGLSIAALGVTSVAAVFVLRYWQAGSEAWERAVRWRLREAEEGLMARRGLAPRDPATGLYTLEFVLHGLEARLARLLRRPRPITCVLMQLEGLSALRQRHGAAAAEDLLQRVGQEVRRNLRADDLVCRAGQERILMALMRCPGKYGPTVSRRVTTNVQRLLLRSMGHQYQIELTLNPVHATLPEDASTPLELVRRVESDLDIKRSLQAVRWQDRERRLAGPFEGSP